jgi:hypothetical protein
MASTQRLPNLLIIHAKFWIFFWLEESSLILMRCR